MLRTRNVRDSYLRKITPNGKVILGEGDRGISVFVFKTNAWIFYFFYFVREFSILESGIGKGDVGEWGLRGETFEVPGFFIRPVINAWDSPETKRKVQAYREN